MARLAWERGHVVEAERLTRRALETARTGGDPRQVGHALGQLGFYALLGPTPVPEAIERCTGLLAQAGDDRRLRASLVKTLGSLHALQGETDLARRLADESSAVLADLGLRLDAAQAAVEFALREIIAGDPLAAEAIAREGFEVLKAMGETSYMCNCAAVLAQALSLQGLHHEASRFAAVSESATDDHDAGAQLQWRAARSRVLTAAGRTTEAVELARSAVEWGADTDMVLLQGDAWSEYARALHAAGRRAEAVAAARTAVELYEAKGATAVVAHARTLLDIVSDDGARRG
jgi:tetratricopeptide (TPR) repeat protein